MCRFNQLTANTPPGQVLPNPQAQVWDDLGNSPKRNLYNEGPLDYQTN